MSICKPPFLDDLIRKHFFQSPSKAAMFLEDEAISYGEFYEDICRAGSDASGIRAVAQGYRRGKHL